jgi:quercetin dioxygenase-like cupin family protein
MNPDKFRRGEIIRIGPIEIRYLVDGSRTGQSGVFEMDLPPGASVPPAYSHENSGGVLYVLEGRLRHSVDGVERDLGPGDCAITPRGVTHGFTNPFDATVRTLTVLTPDIGAQHFRDAAAAFDAGAGVDRAALAEVMRRHGLTLAAPRAPRGP